MTPKEREIVDRGLTPSEMIHMIATLEEAVNISYAALKVRYDRACDMSYAFPYECDKLLQDMRDVGYANWAEFLEDMALAMKGRDKLMRICGPGERYTADGKNLDLAIKADRLRTKAEKILKAVSDLPLNTPYAGEIRNAIGEYYTFAKEINDDPGK